MYDREITMYRTGRTNSVPRQRQTRWWLSSAIVILATSVSRRRRRKRGAGIEAPHVVSNKPVLMRVIQMERRPTAAHPKTPHV
jgi:hypothetical protein